MNTNENKTQKKSFLNKWTIGIAMLIIGFIIGSVSFSPNSEEKFRLGEYPKLLSHYDSLKEDHVELLKETEDWRELSSSQQNAELLKAQKEEDKLQKEQDDKVQAEAQRLVEGTKVYEDDKVKINFKEVTNEGLVFLVENNTDKNLTFQADSFALNGTSTNDFMMSDDIAPQSKGNITARTSDFTGVEPEKISGSMTAFDFEGRDYFEFTFTNVDVSAK